MLVWIERTAQSGNMEVACGVEVCQADEVPLPVVTGIHRSHELLPRTGRESMISIVGCIMYVTGVIYMYDMLYVVYHLGLFKNLKCWGRKDSYLFFLSVKER